MAIPVQRRQFDGAPHGSPLSGELEALEGEIEFLQVAFGGQHPVQRPAQHVFRAIAEHLLPGAAPVGDFPFVVDHDDGIPGRVANGPKHLLAVAQVLLGPATLRQVTEFGNTRSLVFEGDVFALDFQWVGGAVLAQPHRLVRCFRAGQDVAPDGVAPLRGDQQQAVHTDQFVFAVAGQAGQGLVDILDAALYVDANGPHRGFMQAAKPGFAFLQLDLMLFARGNIFKVDHHATTGAVL